MTPVIAAEPTALTVADLHRRFGPMPCTRFRLNPAPGTATEEDAVAIRDHEKLLYELVDGILVRKSMGSAESLIAGLVLTLLNMHVRPRRLGIVLGEAGLLRLSPELIRIPDVSYISYERLPNRRTPRGAVWAIAPDLAVEILSAGNTKKEMDEKLADYFAAGVRLVWYIDPSKRTARAYTAADQSRLVREGGSLDGGEVLPGLVVPLRELFAEPAE